MTWMQKRNILGFKLGVQRAHGSMSGQEILGHGKWIPVCESTNNSMHGAYGHILLNSILKGGGSL